MDASVSSFRTITNSFKICFRRGCKFVGECYPQIHSEGMTMSSVAVSQGSVHSPSNEHVVQPIIQVTGVNDDTQVGLQPSLCYRLHFKRLEVTPEKNRFYQLIHYITCIKLRYNTYNLFTVKVCCNS